MVISLFTNEEERAGLQTTQDAADTSKSCKNGGTQRRSCQRDKKKKT